MTRCPPTTFLTHNREAVERYRLFDFFAGVFLALRAAGFFLAGVFLAGFFAAAFFFAGLAAFLATFFTAFFAALFFLGAAFFLGATFFWGAAFAAACFGAAVIAGFAGAAAGLGRGGALGTATGVPIAGADGASSWGGGGGGDAGIGSIQPEPDQPISMSRNALILASSQELVDHTVAFRERARKARHGGVAYILHIS